MIGSHTGNLHSKNKNIETHKHSVQVSATWRLQKFLLIFLPLARVRHASDRTEHNSSSSPIHNSCLKGQFALKHRKFWLFFCPCHWNYSASSGNFSYPTPFVLYPSPSQTIAHCMWFNMASFRFSAVSRRMISSPFLQLRTMTIGEKGSGVGKVCICLTSVSFIRFVGLYSQSCIWLHAQFTSILTRAKYKTYCKQDFLIISFSFVQAVSGFIQKTEKFLWQYTVFSKQALYKFCTFITRRTSLALVDVIHEWCFILRGIRERARVGSTGRVGRGVIWGRFILLRLPYTFKGRFFSKKFFTAKLNITSLPSFSKKIISKSWNARELSTKMFFQVKLYIPAREL